MHLGKTQLPTAREEIKLPLTEKKTLFFRYSCSEAKTIVVHLIRQL